MAMMLDRQMWTMWDLLLYSNIVKRKNNGLAYADSSPEDQTAKQSLLS